MPRRHVHRTPTPPASGARDGSEGRHSRGARAHERRQGSDHPADRAGAAPADAGLEGVLRLGRGALSAARPGQVDPAAATELPLGAMGPEEIAAAAKARREPAIGVEDGPVGPRPMASASAPRAGDGAAAALLRGARPAAPA